jgi:hypothetical protein
VPGGFTIVHGGINESVTVTGFYDASISPSGGSVFGRVEESGWGPEGPTDSETGGGPQNPESLPADVDSARNEGR